MSIIRDFAYLFVSSERAGRFGLLIKLAVPAVLVFSLSFPYVVPGAGLSPLQAVVAMVYELVVLTHLAGLRRLLVMLRLIVILLLLGLLLNLVSVLMGSEPSDPLTVFLRSFRAVSIVLAVTMFFQLLTVGELRFISEKVGLGSYSEFLAITMSQIPITFVTFSEAYVAAKLKLGGRRASSLIKPLIVDSIVNSRYLAEALYIHGIPPAPKPRLLRPSEDLVLVIPAILIALIPIVVP